MSCSKIGGAHRRGEGNTKVVIVRIMEMLRKLKYQLVHFHIYELNL
jgi:hypothetical protein